MHPYLKDALREDSFSSLCVLYQIERLKPHNLIICYKRTTVIQSTFYFSLCINHLFRFNSVTCHRELETHLTSYQSLLPPLARSMAGRGCSSNGDRKLPSRPSSRRLPAFGAETLPSTVYGCLYFEIPGLIESYYYNRYGQYISIKQFICKRPSCLVQSLSRV